MEVTSINENNETGEYLSTGSKVLDEVFPNGLPVGALSMVFADKDIGKTFLCYQVASKLYKDTGKKTLYIDTEGFSGEPDTRNRLLDFFVDRWGLDRRAPIDFLFPADLNELGEYMGKNFELVVKGKNNTVRAHIWDETKDMESPLAEQIESDDYGLVIVDSISQLFKEKIAVPPQQNFSTRASLFSSVLGRLNQIVKKKHISGLLTSHESKNPANPYDSVPGYSPVTIRNSDGEIDMMTLDELWENINNDVISAGNREIKKVDGTETLDPTKQDKESPRFTDIKAIQRHSFDDDLIRLNTVGGLVDVTPNHSIIERTSKDNCEVRDAKTIKEGDHLRTLWMTSPSSDGFFAGNEDLAWLYGFFAGDGSAYKVKRKNRKDSYSYYTKFSNEDPDIRKRCKKIIRKELNQKLSDDEGTAVIIGNEPTYKFFKKYFYTEDNQKKVPKFIFNSPRNIQQQFLEGYRESDGQKTVKRERSQKTSISQILLQGIIWLMRRTSDNGFTVDYRHDDEHEDRYTVAPTIHDYTIRGRDTDDGRIKDREVVKKVERIPYNGYVYDLTTGKNQFVTGIGSTAVHNTGKPFGSDNIVYTVKYIMQLRGNPKKEKRTAVRWRYPGLTSKRARRTGKDCKLEKDTGYVP